MLPKKVVKWGVQAEEMLKHWKICIHTATFQTMKTFDEEEEEVFVVDGWTMSWAIDAAIALLQSSVSIFELLKGRESL